MSTEVRHAVSSADPVQPEATEPVPSPAPPLGLREDGTFVSPFDGPGSARGVPPPSPGWRLLGCIVRPFHRLASSLAALVPGHADRSGNVRVPRSELDEWRAARRPAPSNESTPGRTTTRDVDATGARDEPAPRSVSGPASGDDDARRPQVPAAAVHVDRHDESNDAHGSGGDVRRHGFDDPGEIVRGTFRHGSGGDARAWRLFMPGGAHGTRRPLVVMFHGCGQDADEFALSTDIETWAARQGFFVLHPEQARRANRQRCWNWFRRDSLTLQSGETALLIEMIDDIIDRHDIDASRVHLAGLSAGGSVATLLARLAPQRFASVCVHSGCAAGSAVDVPSALVAMQVGRQGRLDEHAPRDTSDQHPEIDAGDTAMDPDGDLRRSREPHDTPLRVPTIIFHGDADRIVDPRNADYVFMDVCPPGVTVEAGHHGPSTTALHGARHGCTRRIARDASGQIVAEQWIVHGLGHAWSGGNPAGSHVDAAGPSATDEMLRFFREHSRTSGPTAPSSGESDLRPMATAARAAPTAA